MGPLFLSYSASISGCHSPSLSSFHCCLPQFGGDEPELFVIKESFLNVAIFPVWLAGLAVTTLSFLSYKCHPKAFGKTQMKDRDREKDKKKKEKVQSTLWLWAPLLWSPLHIWLLLRKVLGCTHSSPASVMCEYSTHTSVHVNKHTH